MQSRTKIQLATTIVSLALCTGAAHAERYEIGIGGGAHFVPMDSMDAISSDQSFGFANLHGAVKIPELSVFTGLESEVSLNWDSGQLEGTTFGRISSSLEMDALTISARLRRQLRGPFSAFGEAGLGMQWASLQLQDDRAIQSRPVEGDARALLSSVGVGADLKIAMSKRFSGLLRVQLGYEVATSMQFDATPASSGEDTLEISTRMADLGSINTTGMLLRASFVGSF